MRFFAIRTIESEIEILSFFTNMKIYIGKNREKNKKKKRKIKNKK